MSEVLEIRSVTLTVMYTVILLSFGCDGPEATESRAPDDLHSAEYGSADEERQNPGSDSGRNAESSDRHRSGDEHETHHEHGEHHESNDDGETEHAEDEHHHGGVHLADLMQNIARRSGAIWFAGRHENKKMVDYQLVELREALEEVEEASPVENGVDVAARLKDVVADLERLPGLVESSEIDKFEKAYRGIVAKCSQCHADAGYDFIDVKIPESNPYPNLDMTSSN